MIPNKAQWHVLSPFQMKRMHEVPLVTKSTISNMTIILPFCMVNTGRNSTELMTFKRVMGHPLLKNYENLPVTEIAGYSLYVFFFEAECLLIHYKT